MSKAMNLTTYWEQSVERTQVMAPLGRIKDPSFFSLVLPACMIIALDISIFGFGGGHWASMCSSKLLYSENSFL